MRKFTAGGLTGFAMRVSTEQFTCARRFCVDDILRFTELIQNFAVI